MIALLLLVGPGSARAAPLPDHEVKAADPDIRSRLLRPAEIITAEGD